jgi:hypothetical protein
LTNSDLPFALKTFGNTIFALEENDQKITIGVINNLAKGQLDKPSILEYIKNKLNKTAIFELNPNKPIIEKKTLIKKSEQDLGQDLSPQAPIGDKIIQVADEFIQPQVKTEPKKYQSEVPMPADIALGDTMFYAIYKRQDLNLTKEIPIHLSNISIPEGSEEKDEWLEFVKTKFEI